MDSDRLKDGKLEIPRFAEVYGKDREPAEFNVGIVPKGPYKLDKIDLLKPVNEKD